MRTFNLIMPAVLVMAALLLAGCDSGTASTGKSADSGRTSAIVPEYQLETLNKAKQVEALMKKQDQKTRDAVQ